MGPLSRCVFSQRTMTHLRKDYSTLIFFGLCLIYSQCLGELDTIYQGKNEVWEGDPFEISCVMPVKDLEGWSVNSTVAVLEDNDLGYLLSGRVLDPLREEMKLRVQSAQLYHEGDYRCNRYSRDFHHLKVKPALFESHELEFTESPPKTKENIIKINKSMELYCSSAKDDSAHVSWYKFGRLIVDKSDSNIFIAGMSLIIENAQESDAGRYMCTVDTTFVDGYTDIGRIFDINSPAKIVDFPKKVHIIRNQTLELHCNARGYPAPNVTWFIGNLLASEMGNEDVRISFDYSIDGWVHSNLRIEEVNPFNKGLYTCRAQNSVDSGQTRNYDENTVFVYVMENMIETNEDVPGVGKLLTVGEKLVLLCNTTECSKCTLHWYKDGILLHSKPNHIVIDDHNKSIVIENSSYNDTGVYMCAIDRKHLDAVLNATIVVQSKIKLEKFDASSVAVEGSPLELFCNAKGAPTPLIKWFIGDQEIYDDNERVEFLEHNGLKRGKLFIEEADFDDRNHYTCEAYNQLDSVNTTVFIRIKGKLAALWPFLGICAEVAILCSIIFIYERRKSVNQSDEPDTDLPADNKQRDQIGKGQDIRQRK